ncbi:MAG: MBL fold metallo-hydrolase [Cyanobacteria bacterium P01_A01_bin.114]
MALTTTLTWLDVNSWQIDLNNLDLEKTDSSSKRILIDPWLVGDLVFNNAPWLIRGIRPAPVPIPEQIDLIVLSQGLNDHAHPETLKVLDKTIPVVASENAAGVAKSIGFESVTTLTPGDEFDLDDSLQIKTLPGSPIGPFLTENAYLLKVKSTGLTLYYEPHGYPSEALETIGRVDVVITPIVTLELPLVGPVIRGSEGAPELAQLLKPQLMLPTADGGAVTYTGMISALLKQKGGLEQVRSQLQSAGLKAHVEPLKPMQPFTLAVTPYAAEIPA